MGIIGIVAAGLSSLVGSILITLTAIIATVVSGLVGVLATILSSITAVIGGTIAQITSALTTVTTKVAASVHTASSNLLGITNIKYATVSAWIKAVKAGFTAFLGAIHYKALLEIHDIAYILSSSYREMLNKVYGKLGEFSEAIGRHTGFLEIAIQIARSTSLRVSSFLGKRFDIAEMTWLKDFNGLLERINETTTLYAQNPSQIWHDIDDLIVKPATDAAAEAQLTMFTTVKSLGDMLKASDDMLTTVQVNFGEVVNELPAKWRQDLIPIVENVEDDIRHWRDKIYVPTIETIDKVIDVVYTRTTKAREAMLEISARLARGGDILAAIDELPDDERIEQERKIAEVASRATKRQGDYFEAVVHDNYQTLESILAAVKFETTPELWFVPERLELAAPVGKQAADKASWFVGDY